MQSSSKTVTTFTLDTAELFNLKTVSDYAGASITLQVAVIETHSSNGQRPWQLVLSGYKVRADGKPGQVWTERKLTVAHDGAELAQFPPAILAAVGLA